MDLKPRNAEIFVGIVARIGVDTKAIVQFISDELVKYDYKVEEVHVTDLLKPYAARLEIVESPLEARYQSYISACNKLRGEFSNVVMANLAITAISEMRRKRPGGNDAQSRSAFIINQIKRPEEFETLRQVYGEHYVQISCHADEEVRIQRLIDRITYDHPEKPKDSQWDIEARKLVHTDESQEEEKHGQRVRQAFPLSDMILDANTPVDAQVGIERFFRALFGDKSVTPTREEYGMELANTAAQRSSDLSRQVGAAILSPNMEIQALGCNEVPRAGGGTYWEGSDRDGRDFAIGHDSNKQRSRTILLDLMIRLQRVGALSQDFNDLENIESRLLERGDNIIADAQLMDSLEYGRSVHAEMNAITDAARGGHAIRNCYLFSNTFPCHNCAKHIVAAGISEVIYIHPYPKSYAKELFADSIVINPKKEGGTYNTSGRVAFRQFLGIVGPMYARVFTKARWKDKKGNIPSFEKSKAAFIRLTPIPAYLRTEEILLEEHARDFEQKEYPISWTNSPSPETESGS